jgi:RecJ-like exonuclease
LDKKIKVESHEFICPECKGKGKLEEWSVGKFTVEPECGTCYGAGKLDWIEKIMGKKPDEYHTTLQAWIDEAAKNVSNEIDNEIIESVLAEACRDGSKYKIKEKEEQHDNGVLSELLFHPIIE